MAEKVKKTAKGQNKTPHKAVKKVQVKPPKKTVAKASSKAPAHKVLAQKNKASTKKAKTAPPKKTKAPAKTAKSSAKKAKTSTKIAKAPVKKAKTATISKQPRESVNSAAKKTQAPTKQPTKIQTQTSGSSKKEPEMPKTIPAFKITREAKQSPTPAIKSEIRHTEITNVGFLGIPPYQESKGEEYMNTKQIGHFREILMRWKQALMEEVDRTVHHMKDAINFADPNDRATQEEEFNLELRARDRERKLIRKIDEALVRIDNDEYGYCDACGVEIGIRRLEARPTATLCIDCKTLAEIKEKQTRL